MKGKIILDLLSFLNIRSLYTKGLMNWVKYAYKNIMLFSFITCLK